MESKNQGFKLYKSSKSTVENIESFSLDGMEGRKTKSKTIKKIKRKFSNLSLSWERENVELSPQTYNIKDDYEIIETLGMGTYSYVRHAIEKETNRHVAIKTSRGTNSREMLKNEYELLKRLADDNIIKVYDFTEDESKRESYLIMEYFEGLNLDQYIERIGPLSEKDSIEIINQILFTIEELHDLGIAHRDIKPENILLSSNLEVKLIDFNISKASETKEPFRPEKLKKFNSVYQTQISSPLYWAPELKNGLYYSESVDIWGAGVILFTMLFGSFKSFNLGKFKDATERCQAIADIIQKKETSSVLKDTLTSMLACNPEERPTAKDLVHQDWWTGE